MDYAAMDVDPVNCIDYRLYGSWIRPLRMAVGNDLFRSDVVGQQLALGVSSSSSGKAYNTYGLLGG